MDRLLFFCLLGFTIVTSQPYYLGNFSVTYPAFLNFDYFYPNTDPTLVITSFSPIPFVDDTIFWVPNITQYLGGVSSIKPQTLTQQVTWPNEATAVPYNIFKRDALVVAGGFLIPGKSTGSINLFLLDENAIKGPIQISTDKSEWFYHMVVWKDINNDGRMDILTARANKPIVFGQPGGQLLWYEQPENPFSGAWPEHDLISGPDFFFKMIDIDGDGNEELLSAQFFGAQFVVYWTNDWSNPSSIQSRVIDNTIGPNFGVWLEDVNNDGNIDAIVTNHVDNATQSAIYAYEIPKDFKNGEWSRHLLANGFVTTESQIYGPQASPGGAVAVHPLSDSNTTKPIILLSGDGSQEAYIVSPLSQNPQDWRYNVTVILNGGGTIGQIAAADLDGNGYKEFFVPVYDNSIVHVFTFDPNPPPPSKF